MSSRRLSWLMVFAMGMAAAAVLLRRRLQDEQDVPHLPLPDPPEPPRIVLPRALLETEQAPAPKPEPDAEEPRERAVGEKLPKTPATAKGEKTSQKASEKGSKKENAEQQPQAYCMRCREQRPVADAQEVTTESGRRALSGTCAVCEARIFKFLPSK